MCQYTSLHPQKVGVWCAISKYCVIEPIVHEQTVNSEEYQHILTDFIALLNNTSERPKGWFQQDNAMAYIFDSAMAFIHKFFKERVISVGLWPLRNPDLSPADFCYGLS